MQLRRRVERKINEVEQNESGVSNSRVPIQIINPLLVLNQFWCWPFSIYQGGFHQRGAVHNSRLPVVIRRLSQKMRLISSSDGLTVKNTCMQRPCIVSYFISLPQFLSFICEYLSVSLISSPWYSQSVLSPSVVFFLSLIVLASLQTQFRNRKLQDTLICS